MRDINIYACGGCGINVVNRYLRDSTMGHFVDKIVGIDTSSANPVENDAYEIIRLEGSEGSGSSKATHMKRYPDLVKQVLTKYKPGKVNIIVMSGSGGSGSGIGTFVARDIIAQGIPTLLVVIGDVTSVKERDNTVSTVRSLAAQAKLLDSPVLYIYRENTIGSTQGEVNKSAVTAMDHAVSMFNLCNQRIDYADIKNFFFFNKIVEADAVPTQVNFLTDDILDSYKRKPVAALSLFPDEDAVRAPFPDLLYRKAGLYGETVKGFQDGFHAILDHGSTLEEMQGMITLQTDKKSELSGKFKTTVDLCGDMPEDGMFV